ncbi:unnamed protein product [Rhizopus stolonifer]
MRRIKQTFLKQKITEDNWDDYKRAIESINKWCMEDHVYEYPGFIDSIKELKEPIISSLTSERTILSSTAVDLLIALAKCLNTKFDPINEMILPTIRQLFGRSNKVHVSRSVAGYKQMIKDAKLLRTIPRFCSLLSHQQHQRNDPARVYIAECLESLILANPPEKVRKYLLEIEAAIQVIAVDANPEVRHQARQCFESYMQIFPQQAEVMLKTASRDVLKYLVSTVKRAPPKQTETIPSLPQTRLIRKMKRVDLKDQVQRMLDGSKGKDFSSKITLKNGVPYYSKPIVFRKDQITKE